MRDEQGRAVAAWGPIGRVATAQVVMLRDAAILDDAAAAALLAAVDGVRRAEPPSGMGLTELVGAFDERWDALSPPGAVGAGSLGRARADVAATVARLALRDALLGLGEATGRLRAALLDLAGEHAFTLMPAFAGGQAVQPTTFAHFLGGAIAPLGRAHGRLRGAYAEMNRSPLGAVALAGTGLPIDRERVAALLGFDEPIPSLFDALAAVDHLASAAAVAASIAAATGRFGGELLTWLRTEPNAIRVPEGWRAEAEADLPGFRPPARLERLVVDARRVVVGAETVSRLVSETPYGPAGTTLDAALGPLLEVVAGAAGLAHRMADFVAGIEVNRAYLANRAGRDHATSGELVDLLVADEGLDVAAARAIAALTVRRAAEQGAEASGITPEMIDAAALLAVGRELGVEIERIGRALAPRRVVERRGLAGGPAPGATRAYLDQERPRLGGDERWRDEALRRVAAAVAELEGAEAEILRSAG